MLAVPQGLSVSLGPGKGSELLYKEGGEERTQLEKCLLSTCSMLCTLNSFLLPSSQEVISSDYVLGAHASECFLTDLA